MNIKEQALSTLLVIIEKVVELLSFIAHQL